jgi:hypothetical protein
LFCELFLLVAAEPVPAFGELLGSGIDAGGEGWGGVDVAEVGSSVEDVVDEAAEVVIVAAVTQRFE